MKRSRHILLLAGFSFFLLAFAAVGVLPWVLPADKEPTPFVRPYTEVEARGRKIYIREVCWHCHSQFVRPVGNDPERYGPVTVAGELIYDRPQLLGTRRLGPDLAREGGLRTDDWHRAHLLDPQAMSPGSVMPKYTWLSEEELDALVAYLQRLGTGIGPWREEAMGTPAVPGAVPQATPQVLALGKKLYTQHCAGCHGDEGDGKGPAAAILKPPPADFTDAEWVYGGSAQEVFQTITRGVPGTAMPGWSHLSDEERWALVHYVKHFERP